MMPRTFFVLPLTPSQGGGILPPIILGTRIKILPPWGRCPAPTRGSGRKGPSRQEAMRWSITGKPATPFRLLPLAGQKPPSLEGKEWKFCHKLYREHGLKTYPSQKRCKIIATDHIRNTD